ncbi:MULTISPECIES: MarR family winged helix-turn-helix transcriptional regulator [unclassified Curtobacterium]|uniref:MarR family winged helix-turn-helix transcriptional regulator n=1 Tax=unclassified Curtobacterium TaxID=257496 RepID=UPI000826A8D1|nr:MULTISPECIES: MarR family transcriptional regulator [unclassified Curtobacterium]WIA97469.1 MarR family transcriptional regulator [Curtobacterium sp. MCBA15_004]WIB00790.1 MarR family transcriptional regulator [Curtobacterium sp. MCBA15_012]
MTIAAPVVPTPTDGLSSALRAFRTLQTQHARVLTQESAARGLHATDLRFVLVVAGTEGAGLTPKQAADHLELTTGAMTSLIDRLERRGHLERRPNPGDRRSILVQLTPTGAQLADEVVAVYREAFRDGVPASELAALAAAFTGVGAALRRHRP